MRQVNSMGFLCLRGVALTLPHFPARVPGNGACSSLDHSLINDRVSVLFIGVTDGGQLHVNGSRQSPATRRVRHQSRWKIRTIRPGRP